MPRLKHCQMKAQKRSQGCLDPWLQLYLINHLLEALSDYAWHGWEKSRTKNMSYRGIYFVIRKVLMMRRRKDLAEGDLAWAVLSNGIKHTFLKGWGGQLTNPSMGTLFKKTRWLPTGLRQSASGAGNLHLPGCPAHPSMQLMANCQG